MTDTPCQIHLIIKQNMFLSVIYVGTQLKKRAIRKKKWDREEHSNTSTTDWELEMQEKIRSREALSCSSGYPHPLRSWISSSADHLATEWLYQLPHRRQGYHYKQTPKIITPARLEQSCAQIDQAYFLKCLEQLLRIVFCNRTLSVRFLSRGVGQLTLGQALQGG
jgi:hypothetical protein